MNSARQMETESGPESGFALIVVIMFLLTVTALMTPFVLAARSELSRSSDIYRKDRMDLLAEGLGQVLAHQLALPESEKIDNGLEVNSKSMHCVAAGIGVIVRVQDQRGLADLNKAGEAQLQVAFHAIGYDNTQAQSMARAVVEYRDTEKAEQASTAQDSVWDGYKRGAFAAVEELYDLKPLAGEPLQRLAETFTIYNPDGLLLSSALPPPLAEVLPTEPTQIYPYVRSDDFGTPQYRIDVTATVVTNGISGYYGAVVNAPRNDQAAFTRVAGAVNPSVLPGSASKAGVTPEEVKEMACEILFGPTVATILRGIDR